MELKATSLGKRLAQHPYDRVRLLNAGLEVSGERHHYVIPFNQLVRIQCKRGMVWGELEFELPGQKVVRLHGTDWQETQRFHHHLNEVWQQWSEEMSVISASVLQAQSAALAQAEQADGWMSQPALSALQAEIADTFAALPMPLARMTEFDACRAAAAHCRAWLEEGEARQAARNRRWAKQMQEAHPAWLATSATGPLDERQVQAVVNGERTVQVVGMAGSGKTAVLVARAGWLVQRGEAAAGQILLIASGQSTADELNGRLKIEQGKQAPEALTVPALALQILQQGGRKALVLSKLEQDEKARRALLLRLWRQQCEEKKPQANGWRLWLEEELGWTLPAGAFWKNRALGERLAGRLDRWLGLMRAHGGSQAAIIAEAPEAPSFAKQVKLMAPLVKGWRSALKEEGAVDADGAIRQALDRLNKGRFNPPWRHILLDEWQDLPPLHAQLLRALCTGDDGPSLFVTVNASLSHETHTQALPAAMAVCTLARSYRADAIGELADRLLAGHVAARRKPGLRNGPSPDLLLLPDDQLAALLDKLSGFAQEKERVLLLARDAHQRPALLQKAKTRWPKLSLAFSTIQASAGQEAEYVIVLEAMADEGAVAALEQELTPAEEAGAESQRLLYLALTRARTRAWLLSPPEAPSPWAAALRAQGVPQRRTP